MKIVCARCQQQGRPAVIREDELHDGVVTHGICDGHAVLLLAEIRRSKPSKSFPSLHSAGPDLPIGPILEPSRELAGSSRSPKRK